MMRNMIMEGHDMEAADETEALCNRLGLGPNATHFVAMSFRGPDVALIAKAYKNSTILWFGEILTEEGAFGLSGAMYRAGLNPKTTVIVADASGCWQDAQQPQQPGSYFDILRECGWFRINFPDRYDRRNPRAQSRVDNDARMFGLDRVHFEPDKVPRLIESVTQFFSGEQYITCSLRGLMDAMGFLHWRVSQ